MTSNRTQLIARLSILTALTVVLGYYTKLPTPTGIVTLLDLGVYFTAFYFGRKEGAIVGGVGAFLLDLISGYPQWMFFSLICHGVLGFFAGLEGKSRYLGLVLAAVSMVGGYALFDSIMNGVGAGLAGMLGNFMQNAFGLVVGYVLYKAFPASLKKMVTVK